MSSQRKKRSSKRHLSAQRSIIVFRRVVESFANRREGLSSARSKVPSSHFPAIVRQLGRTPAYLAVFSPTAFPESPTDIKNGQRLVELSIERELLWNACVLSLFRADLSEFASKKLAFDEAFPSGDLESAFVALKEIQIRFGFSFFFLRYQFILTQLAQGLEAQKAILNEIGSEPEIIPSIRWMAIYFSLIAEETSSAAVVERALRSITGDLQEYLRHYILPFDSARFENLIVPLNWDEPNSIIDRYETFILVSQRYVAKYAPEIPWEVTHSLELLSEINDPRLTNLMTAARKANLSYAGREGKALRAADAYILGEYAEAERTCPDQLEIIARSRAFRGLPRAMPENIAGLRDRAVAFMHASLIGLEHAPRSSAELKRLSVVFCTHPYSAQIAQFLSRTYAPLVKNRKYRDVDRIAALNGALDNPWNLPIFAEMAGESRWVENLAEDSLKSPALRLQLVVHGGPRFGHLLPTGMPHHRHHACLGHLKMTCNDPAGAAKEYMIAGEGQNDYIRLTTLGYLFDAKYLYGAFDHCLALVIDQIVTGSMLPRALPLEKLAERCLRDENLKRNVDSAILICRLAQHVNRKWERDLSDVFENALASFNVERASELQPVSHNIPRSRLIFFLKHVAIRRVLEDCIIFDSLDDVNSERIAICQQLLSLDSANRDEYLAEIKAITREMNIAISLQKINQSRIYAHDAEIIRLCESSLKEDFTKFRQLLSAPEIENQAKRLAEKFKGIDDDRFRLPAFEKEALVSAMFQTVATEFSLNPAYGLDTHISTYIRHGVLEGYLMRPLNREGIVCSKTEGVFALPAVMMRRITHLSSKERDALTDFFLEFTTTFQKQIDRYDKILRIRGVDGQHTGAFHFALSEASRKKICNAITLQTTLLDLSAQLLEECWNITERVIEQIRSDLHGRFAETMNEAFGLLFKSIELHFKRQHVSSVLDACARARTAFLPVVEEVAGWFRRATDLTREPFDLDTALQVTLKEIANCYVDAISEPDISVTVSMSFPGRCLDGFTEILFILIQNVIQHSGLVRPRIKINVTSSDKWIVVRISNPLAPSVSIDSVRAKASKAVEQYKQDSAMRLVRREGGSGLSKIWTIAEYDLLLKHELSFTLDESQWFAIVFKFTLPDA